MKPANHHRLFGIGWAKVKMFRIYLVTDFQANYLKRLIKSYLKNAYRMTKIFDSALTMSANRMDSYPNISKDSSALLRWSVNNAHILGSIRKCE